MEGEQKTSVSIIAAMSVHDRGIGKDGKLLWHIPEDLRRFKELTRGHPVIMGRKTFESVMGYLGRPLPERTNIVVTRNPDYRHPGAEVHHTLEDALARGQELDREEIFIGGGGEIYAQALPHADRLYLTLIDGKRAADSFFPDYERIFAKKITEETCTTRDRLNYTWMTLERK